MRCWMRDGRLGRWGGELGGQASRGVFAIDLRQGTEQEVRDIGQHCGGEGICGFGRREWPGEPGRR